MLSMDDMQMENNSLAWVSVFKVQYKVFIDGKGGKEKNYLGDLRRFCQIYLVRI